MEERDNLNQNLVEEEKEMEIDYVKHVVVFFVLVILAGGGYWAWTRYLSPEAKENRQLQFKYQEYIEREKLYQQ